MLLDAPRRCRRVVLAADEVCHLAAVRHSGRCFVRLLAVDGEETWGQLILAVRHLRYTQEHVGWRSMLALRIEDEITELKQRALVLSATRDAD